MFKNSFGYLVKEGLRNIRANRQMSVASIGVLIACMVLIGGAGVAVLAAWPRLRGVGRGVVVAGALVALGGVAIASHGLLPHWRDTDALFSRFERTGNFSRSALTGQSSSRHWLRRMPSNLHSSSSQRPSNGERLPSEVT